MKLAIAGAAGRMGRVLTRLISETEGLGVAGGLEAEGSSFVGADMGELAGIGPLGVKVESNPLSLFTQIDGLIDFTVPEATLALSELSAQARIVHVIGTTGIDESGDARIKAASRHARIVKSGNMSLGVNLLAAMVKKIAATLDEEFDIEILEMHHRHKIDAPSGTALLLGKAAAQGRKIDLAQHSVRTRDGHTGARTRGDIGFATLRGGSVVGEHTVIFAGQSERIELSHRAESREIFARGAIKAARWAMNQKPGLYTMTDVLELE
jgi:4-hydroxy-tetrahydrodipicolinate reductase